MSALMTPSTTWKAKPSVSSGTPMPLPNSQVSRWGAPTKSPNPRTSETTSVIASAARSLAVAWRGASTGALPPSSSGIDCSAEKLRAESPFHRLSMSTMPPRSSGQRSGLTPPSSVSHACSRTTICLSGRRTATTKLLGERIITPSITACPPT